MAFTTARPIWVDGVRLDSLAWNVTAINRAVAPRRANDLIVPGMDGVVASLNDDLDQVPFGLEMFVRGTDVDGVVPGTGAANQFRDNLDELVHLFGTRSRLLDIWYAQDDVPQANYILDPSAQGQANTFGPLQPLAAFQFVGSSFTRAAITGAGDAPAGFGLTTYQRLTFTANNGASGIEWYGHFTPGYYDVSFYMRSSRAGVSASWSIRNLSVVNVTGPGVATVSNDVPYAAGANTWQRVTRRVKVTGSGALAIGPSINSAVALVAGDTVDITGIQATPVNVNDPFTTFFWGGQTGYYFTGTQNASPSVSSAVRRAYAKVTDTIAPEMNTPGSVGTFSVALNLVEGCWRDVGYVDTTLAAWDTLDNKPIPALDGSTERIPDAIIVVTGPVTNPVLSDVNTGAYVSLNLALAAGDTWRVNVGTWSSRTSLSGTPLTVTSADTAGTDRQSLTTFGGMRNQSRFLPLTPVREAGAQRRVQLRLAGTAKTAATSVTMRTVRRFAA